MRKAVRALDGIRDAESGHPDDTCSAGRGALPAKWTLVDTFDRDGVRYVVARENRPRPKGLGDIPRAERSVLECAIRGLATKEIAHALAISDATVRVLLMRAARRCKVTGRRELIAWARQVQP